MGGWGGAAPLSRQPLSLPQARRGFLLPLPEAGTCRAAGGRPDLRPAAAQRREPGAAGGGQDPRRKGLVSLTCFSLKKNTNRQIKNMNQMLVQ